MNEKLVAIDPKELTENPFRLIGDRWTLITAGNEESLNTMTASWGGFGVLWNKPVVYVFIRPQRHTLGFVQRENHFTLSFFGEEQRPALQLLGSRSGRDGDKVAASGLTPCFTELGNPTFEEATLVMECRKLFDGTFKAEDFVIEALRDTVYPNSDFHHVFVGEIVGCWTEK